GNLQNHGAQFHPATLDRLRVPQRRPDQICQTRATVSDPVPAQESHFSAAQGPATAPIGARP
ncbi:hypothetical protein WICPIJ_006758, partial [Wickerhamomyces pijperi]